MLAQIRKARQSESGFTLIELLMVIVILGVLAGIVVFAVGGITDKGELSACKSDVKTVTTAVEAYYANQAASAYPADETAAQTALVPAFLHSWPTTVNYTYSAATGPVIKGAGGTCPATVVG
jgi:general secretion pathway protein G